MACTSEARDAKKIPLVSYTSPANCRLKAAYTRRTRASCSLSRDVPGAARHVAARLWGAVTRKASLGTWDGSDGSW